MNFPNSNEFYVNERVPNKKNISHNRRRENLIQKSYETQNMSMKLSEKDLIIHIISQDNEYDRTLRLTPWGIEGSSKLVNYEEGSETYFGSNEYINDVS